MHSDEARSTPPYLINCDAHSVHGGVSDLVISRVDKNLVKDFVQAGYIAGVLEHHPIPIMHPQLLLLLLCAAYVCVWPEKDMLQLALLLHR